MAQRKFVCERREVAARIADALQKHPDKKVKVRYFEIRYFRSQWHEEEMLRNLNTRVNEQLGHPLSASIHVGRSSRGRLRSVSFKIGHN